MRRPRFRLWVASIQSCRSRQDESSATVSSIIGTERYRATLPLETATGRVHGKTTARHTSQDFVAFLREVVAHCPARQQIHIILDNPSAHKTRLVDEFLHKNPSVQFHFTPTYSSWLNQVELWFGKIKRYIRAYSANAKPIQWKYSDPKHRIRSNEFTATCH